MRLREYQKNCLEVIQSIFDCSNKVNKYVVMPTGTGKTKVFKNISKSKVLILENRSDLRDQIAGRLSNSSPDVLCIGSIY